MEQIEIRANMYGLLSRLLLQEVDSEVISFLKKSENLDLLFPNLKEWKIWNELEDEKLINQHLNPDFTNISILHLVPYETFYTREDMMIETGGANPVTDYYHQYGFKVEFDIARVISPDHIGIELEFMNKLVLAELEALKNGDSETAKKIQEVQKEFLEKHILNWVALYLINMKYEAFTPFYHDLAETTLSFLLEDYEYLNGNS
ncbi:MAG TPA: dehydrogenase [Campylobacterales bacterium]|nr:dehydrogenase [Campylobacterales bacterium]